MEPGCGAARGFALLWEEKGGCPELESGLGAFEAHLASCQECGDRYRHLLALIERDASARGAAATAAPTPDATFVERVMLALPKGNSAESGRRRRALFPAVAAAAILLVVGGLALSRAGPSAKGGETVSIHFTLDAPDASSVMLVGSFSGWSVDDRFKLRRVGAERWALSVRLKKDELYTYGFLIDGERWLADPRAAETVDDGFGGANSLLRL
jgi:hypothetical protein